MKTTAPSRLTIRQLARKTGLSEHAVSRHIGAAGLKPDKGHAYDAEALLAQIRKSHAKDTRNRPIAKDNARLVALKCDRLEIEIAKERATLIPLADITRDCEQAGATLTQTMMGLGSELAPMLVGLDAVAIQQAITAKVRTAIDQCHRQLEAAVEKAKEASRED